MIDDILRQFMQPGQSPFPKITRKPYMPYQMATALQVVEAIGKSRNPKFRIDDDNRFAYEQLIRWVHADPDFRCIDPESDPRHRQPCPGRLEAGIYLAGNTGTGKSWAMEIMAVYCTIDNPVYFVNDKAKALQWQNVRTDAVCDEFQADGSINAYKQRNTICFQDFGTERRESVYMGNRSEVMRQIVESRGDRTDLITHFTSNFAINDDEIADKYGDRVISRLREMCNYIEIRGVDRRKL